MLLSVPTGTRWVEFSSGPRDRMAMGGVIYGSLRPRSRSSHATTDAEVGSITTTPCM